MSVAIEATKLIQQGQDVWLKCEATPGMFAYECAVVINGCGRRYETMIDKEFILFPQESSDNRQGRSACIKVSPISIDEVQRTVLVELPRQIVGGGRRIPVPLSEIDTES